MTERMPMLALRGMTAFPKMMLHFDVGRDKSMKSIAAAMKENQTIFLVAQREIRTDDPAREDVFSCGTVAKIVQILKFPADNTRVLVEGVYRAKITEMIQFEPYLLAEVEALSPTTPRISPTRHEALVQTARELFADYAEVAPKMTPEVMMNVLSIEDLGDLADYIAQNMPTRFTNKQAVLEEMNPYRRLKLVCQILSRDTEIFQIENELSEKVHEQIDKNQRDYFLREQLKAIQNELNEGEDTVAESESYLRQIDVLNLPEEVSEKLKKEAERLTKMQYTSPEGTVIRTYLDTCLALPWNTTTKDRLSLPRAKRLLDAEHYGMTRVKDRILELLAVRQLSSEMRGQILCLVGPPGVGKTSIGHSIADAMGRKFARLSLGGVRDEADIRGHRKTYIGAMPGRIMTALKQAGSKNAVLLLDEVDKMSTDFRGDPSAALLEVLDAEQNVAFRDHYLEVPFDLSDVLFITTANTTETIPRPLLDRMEVIELTSYTTEEKFQIAKRHLIKRALAKHGLNSATLKIDNAVIYRVIEEYTRESGVRTLERELGTLCRKAAKELVVDDAKSIHITTENLKKFLGAPRYRKEVSLEQLEPGVVNGLAWTAVGGEILQVEVNAVTGSGKLEITGNLGTVMTESAKAALTYVRSRAQQYQIPEDFYKTHDIHIHFPEGAIPKDGPSAGITIATALLSALTNTPACADVAMTGEISIRGRVLPIGGLKEKTMAAYRAGIKTVFIPEENRKDLEELDETVRNALTFVPVGHVDAVIDRAICWDKRPQPEVKPSVTTIPPDLPNVEPETRRPIICQ